MPVPANQPVPPAEPERRRATARLLGGISPLAAELGALFAARGHELALVGGSVRDVFLGRQHTDLDLTTDATPERSLEIIRPWAENAWPVGIAFGTIGARKGDVILEITTYRADSYQRDSRKPAVRYGTSLEQDLVRRDFTVNAVAVRLPGNELVDPFNGLRDLTAGVLRTPGKPEDSFGDDPLRILRAARFVSQLGLRPVPELRTAMTAMADRLSIVSAERIADELTKLLLATRPGGPVAGIELMTDAGVAEHVLPEVPGLRLEVDEHHRHKDVYRHSLTVLDQAISLEGRYGLDRDLRLRLAALLHDIGKPATRVRLPGGKVAFHHHDVRGAAMARARLKALRFPGDVVADVSRLIELHLRFHGYPAGEWTDSAVRRYVTDAGPLLPRLHALTRADCTTRNRAKAKRLARAYDNLEQRIAELSSREQLARIRPDLDGNQIMRLLGIGPGPLVGKAYKHLLELRMEHGPLGADRAAQELLRWAAEAGLAGGSGDDGGAGDSRASAQ
jgi:poly(A) polymerase